MLETLGYEEAAERDAADLILFNTCSIRESADNRLIGNLGEAKRLKSEDPSRVVGVGGCWSQSLKDKVFEQFPFVDVAFGPGQIDKLGEFLQSDDLSAQGYFEFEGFPGDLPMKRERPFQGWVQISVGCNCVCSYCIVPSTRGREASRSPADIVREVEAAGGRRRQGGHAARAERELLRPRPAEGRPHRLRRRCWRCWTRSRGSSASATRARTRRTCASGWSRHTRSCRACASTSTCRCSPAPAAS